MSDDALARLIKTEIARLRARPRDDLLPEEAVVLVCANALDQIAPPEAGSLDAVVASDDEVEEVARRWIRYGEAQQALGKAFLALTDARARRTRDGG
jgi:hypothetical protein